jgi:cellobiose phosphorylase
MRYGYFDDENREYVIEQPDTPLPWINYLGSEEYFGLISNTAGGYSFYKNAPLDMGGHYLYLRDGDSHLPEPLIWSLSWMPVRAPLELSVYSTVKFNLWDETGDAINYQKNYSMPVTGFDTQREVFLGPYRGWDSPVAAETGQMSDSVAHG